MSKLSQELDRYLAVGRGPRFQAEEEETDVFDHFARSGQMPVR